MCNNNNLRVSTYIQGKMYLRLSK